MSPFWLRTLQFTSSRFGMPGGSALLQPRSVEPQLTLEQKVATVRGRWSIGIFRGNSLTTLVPAPEVTNPIIDARAIVDRPHALFVADPFMVKEAGRWYLFFEVFDPEPLKGVIGYAESSDGISWNYRGTALEENCHLSYPQVFKHEDQFYMIPETKQFGAIRLYRAESFPSRWVFDRELIRGRYTDPSIFFFDNLWWLYAGNGPYCSRLFYADSLQGPWRRHRKRYIHYRKKHCARPGGRIVVVDGRPIRFAQDSVARYGHRLRAYRITELTKASYAEEALTPEPLLAPSGGTEWNGQAMHHIDAHKLQDGSWFAVVDGTYDLNE